MTIREIKASMTLRLLGFTEHDGYWYAPGDWGDEYGPWPNATAALKWANKKFF